MGILFGIIVGSINVGFGMKLGLAGGPLVVAILLSRFGYKFAGDYILVVSSLMLRELGICLFLASLGISLPVQDLPRRCSIPPVCGG